MELSGLALKTTCHLVYTQGGRPSLCVRLHGASNISQRPFGTRPWFLSLCVEIAASSEFSKDGGSTNTDEIRG